MSERSVMIVAGTRPEVIKLAPVIWSLDKLGVNYVFVWSGQHYDYELSWVFFEQLGLPKPHVNLNVGSSSHSEQTARVIVGVEGVIRDLKPSVVVALGDTNTTLGATLASAKTLTPFAHVEAGLRSWDRTMPEEVNRIVADVIAEVNFAPTWLAAVNLVHSGVPMRKVYVTGNTIVDVVYKYESFVVEEGERLLDVYGLEPERFILVTVHRQENTDMRWRLESIVRALVKLSEHLPVVFPVHPRTMDRLQRYGLLEVVRSHIRLLNPLGYFQFLGLLARASMVLTDSGGVQEEACLLGVPTLTLRYNTERPETVLAGTNVVVGVEAERVVETALKLLEVRGEIVKRRGCNNMLGDGRAGERIAGILKDYVEGKPTVEESDTREDPYIVHVLFNGMPIEGADVIIAYGEDGIPTFELSKAKWYLLRTPRSKLTGWSESP
jgi:UDP-N-acetylglucosamine 2-epimerase (non-hydrolysing)